MGARYETGILARDGGVRVVPTASSGSFVLPANEPGLTIQPALFSHPGACVLLSFTGEVAGADDAEAFVAHGDVYTAVLGDEAVTVYYRIVDSLSLEDITVGANDALLISYIS
jgi:hypothetical protein